LIPFDKDSYPNRRRCSQYRAAYQDADPEIAEVDDARERLGGLKD